MAPVFIGEHESAAPPRWPKIIGWISIVVAGLEAAGIVVSLFLYPDNELRTTYVVISFTGLLIVLLLAGGGLALLRQRRSARPLHLVYAWITLLSAVFLLVLLTGTPLRMPASKIVAMMLHAAYPLFLVFWLGRPRIRAEMAAWGT